MGDAAGELENPRQGRALDRFRPKLPPGPPIQQYGSECVCLIDERKREAIASRRAR